MTTKHPSFESSIEVTADFKDLYGLSGFLGNWVDRAGTLNERGLFINFKPAKMFIRKVPKTPTDTAGLITLPFWTEDDVTELHDMMLVVSLHKVLSMLNWVSKTDSTKDITFKITSEGQVYMVGSNNTIHVESAWYAALEEGESPFMEYEGSSLEHIQHVYAYQQNAFEYGEIESKALQALRHSVVKDEDSGATARDKLLSGHALLEKDLEVGKIDTNLVYIKNKHLPNEGSFQTLQYSDSLETKMNVVDPDDRSLISYSRMSLFFAPLNDQDFTNRHPIVAGDGSTHSQFLSTFNTLLKSMVSRIMRNEDLVVSSFYFPTDTEDSLPLISVEFQQDGVTDYSAILLIPAAGTMGMAPPSKDDISAIVPNIDTDNCMYVTIDYKKLKETMEFWDSLQRVDGADIVTPLKPITMSVDDVGGQVVFTMATERSNNEASFDTHGPINFKVDREIQIPFDPLMKILNNSLFTEADANNYITLMRRWVEDPAEIIFSRNGCVAIIAEFV